MADYALLLGDQLFERVAFPPEVPIFMREDPGLARRNKHHKQKIILFFSAMRHQAEVLSSRVHYREFDPSDDASFLEAFAREMNLRAGDVIHAYEPADLFFQQELIAFAESKRCEIRWYPNPSFLTSLQDWTAYRGSRKRLLMGDFYVVQRRKLKILVTPDGEPLGGKWSYDADNRKPIPAKLVPPDISGFASDSTTEDVKVLVQRHFSEHPGEVTTFSYAVTHLQASAALDTFISERLATFGDYEDALSTRGRTLYHSMLSPYLNCGLLTPLQIVNRSLELGSNLPVNSLEGFIRQVIGWREFIRWMDWEYKTRGWKPPSVSPNGTALSGTFPNALGHSRRLGPEWYTGETGMPPLDLVIRRAQTYGWAHHIERLMVVGSAMLMSEVHPDDAYNWFLEMFVDSAEWVMTGNVYGMSLYADDALFATKPYISGSAYLLKMSDYPKGDWTEVWDGLYWRFLDKHREHLKSNQRIGMVLGTLEKMDPSRKTRIFEKAQAFIERTTRES